jgi:carbamoyl-phosphate synthase large subunit
MIVFCGGLPNMDEKILIGGAGGVPSENVILSLLNSSLNCYVIGIGSEPYDLVLSYAAIKYQVPYAIENGYKESLFSVFKKEKPLLAHFQNDNEILVVSRLRDDILNAGVKLYMPDRETVENCVDKSRSSEIWKTSGIKIPKTMNINDEEDLKNAFEKLAINGNGTIWLRCTIGGGGRGALPTNNYKFAKLWIDRYKGWGEFTAAELLTPESVTWSSIWFEGELVVAQTRKRRGWNFGNRTLSGITGVTKVGETFSADIVDRVAQDSILSIDKRPHGIFSVDMTYDNANVPNPTEINISRFFTTIYFFTKAGLNMPEIFVKIALRNEFPSLEKKINPLPNGLLWIRSMDREPLLMASDNFTENIHTEMMP